MATQNLTPDDIQKVSKVWLVIKQIIEIILAALGGAATAFVAQSCGLLSMIAGL